MSSFGMPTHWSNELAELFLSTGRAHPDFLIVLQTEGGVGFVNRRRALGLKIEGARWPGQSLRVSGRVILTVVC